MNGFPGGPAGAIRDALRIRDVVRKIAGGVALKGALRQRGDCGAKNPERIGLNLRCSGQYGPIGRNMLLAVQQQTGQALGLDGSDVCILRLLQFGQQRADAVVLISFHRWKQNVFNHIFVYWHGEPP